MDILSKYPEFQEVDFELQDGVRGIPGTPSIASKIMDDRIPKCDIFIADLSVINRSELMEKAADDNNIKYIFTINNNVLIEFGIAYDSVTLEQIICILNNHFGSPIENQEIFPFDLRSLRTPIEYCLSDQNSKEIKIIEKELVRTLSQAITLSCNNALLNKKNQLRPFLTFNEWSANLPKNSEFIHNEVIAENFSTLHQLVLDNHSIRIIGLSGLGKTRLINEFFNPNRINNGDRILASKLLYFNCNSTANFDFNTIFQKITDAGENRILVLDNCDKSIHRLALSYKHIQCISIDSNPEESESDKISGVTYITIKKSDLTSVVETLIERDFVFLNSEQKRTIKQFSQGIPLMAVLLAESVKNGEQFLGKLNETHLLNNLLGRKGTESRNRRILQACSLFSNFGFYDELCYQLSFIASNKSITPIDGDSETIIADFKDVCTFFLKREIFERKGRFLGIRPLPLAILLTTEWLETSDTERITKIVKDIEGLPEPHKTKLSEALAEQMQFLGFSEKATVIIDHITCIGSPFDSTEVLNTELGSRFFRSFSQVNPVAISNALYRLFGGKSKAELLAIDRGRRNLIWALETLCFDKRSFENAIKTLYSFAVAENENYSNNATGQFLQLFHINLAGTEVDLNERLKIITWGLQKDHDYKQLAITAMDSAILTQVHRIVGAEYQGLSTLNDFRPSFREVSDYWSKILNILLNLFKSNDQDFSNQAKAIIAGSIRIIAEARLINIALPIIEEIAEISAYKWDECLKNLKLAMKYERTILLEKDEVRILDLIKKLEHNYDFGKKYTNIYDSYFLEEEITSSSDNLEEAVSRLVNEFVDKSISWKENLKIFYTSYQPYSFSFGKALGKRYDTMKLKNKFIYDSIAQIKSITTEKVTISVLAGFISEISQSRRDSIYNVFIEDVSLNPLLFDLISINEHESKYLDILYSITNKNEMLVPNFVQLSYGDFLFHLKTDELRSLFTFLFQFGDRGTSSVFIIINRLTYKNNTLKKEFIVTLRKCILDLGIIYSSNNNINRYQWYNTISEILEVQDDPEFAKIVNHEIIKAISYSHPLSFDTDIRRIYNTLLDKYIDYVWTEIGYYIKYYELKNLLGAHIGGIYKPEGLIVKVEKERLLQWCDTSLIAQSRIAELVPIFAEDNSNYNAWHPLTLELINRYGSNEEMLYNISANMGSFSWSGSLVSLMLAQKALISQLTDHAITQVAEWARNRLVYLEKRIESVNILDQEMLL